MKKIGFLVLALMVSVVGMAQNAEIRFKEANDAYNEGNFDQAMTGYNTIEAEGLE